MILHGHYWHRSLYRWYLLSYKHKMRNEVAKRRGESQLGLINPEEPLLPGTIILAWWKAAWITCVVFFPQTQLDPRATTAQSWESQGSGIHRVQLPQTTLNKHRLCKRRKSHVVMDRWVRWEEHRNAITNATRKLWVFGGSSDLQKISFSVPRAQSYLKSQTKVTGPWSLTHSNTESEQVEGWFSTQQKNFLHKSLNVNPTLCSIKSILKVFQ